MALSEILSETEDAMANYLTEEDYDEKYNHLLLKYVKAIREYYDSFPNESTDAYLKEQLIEIRDGLNKVIEKM